MRRTSSFALLGAAFAGVSFVSGIAGAATYGYFADVPESHWAFYDIEWNRNANLMMGTASALFEPDRAVTRAELAVVNRRIIGEVETLLFERIQEIPGSLGDARDAQRRSDVNTILNSIYQYVIDNNGVIPPGITTTKKEICRTAASNCTGKVDLDILTGSYIVQIPRDPLAESHGNGTRYFAQQDVNGRITISAPDAETDSNITVTR